MALSLDLDFDLQTLGQRDAVPWHQHDRAYAAIVLGGGYEEAGDEGRREARAGDVLVHPPFSAHRDIVSGSGARVVNVSLPVHVAFSLPSGRVADPDRLVHDLRHDPASTATILAATVVPVEGLDDLPDALAATIARDPSLSLTRWAAAQGTSERTLRRQFALAYGVSPKHFRARAKAKRALELIMRGDGLLVEIALACGFADQAHMSRAMSWLTCRSPGHWRRFRPSQDGARPGPPSPGGEAPDAG